MNHKPCRGGGRAGCRGVREQCAGEKGAFAFVDVLRLRAKLIGAYFIAKLLWSTFW